jgi:NitT/TauT family transport system ATP-binding protein
MRDLLARMIERHASTIVFVTHSISEAVRLSDRVIVLSPRPARVVVDAEIPLARPRAADVEDSTEFAATCSTLRHALLEAMHA